MPRPIALAAGLLLAAPLATAQHTGLVLFGEADPEGLALTPEQTHVAPMSSPYTHEDSFVTTGVRAYYVYHDFPASSAIGGGNAQVFAVQARLALTDNLQFVAYKDGYTIFDSGLVESEGFNDIAAGLKYSFLQDWENDLHAAVGIGYEIGIGEEEALQEDDELRVWTSVDKGFGPLHVGGTVNLLVPTGSEDALGDSTRIKWHARADYFVCDWFSPALEFNGYHVVDEGDNTPLPFMGVDVANFGGGQSEDVVTIAPGLEFRPKPGVGIRAAYETPLTRNDDLFGYRWTFSLALDF